MLLIHIKRPCFRCRSKGCAWEKEGGGKDLARERGNLHELLYSYKRGNLHELNTWQPEWTVYMATCMKCARGNLHEPCTWNLHDWTHGSPLHELNTWQPAMLTRFFWNLCCKGFGRFSPCMLLSRFLLLLLFFLSLFYSDMNQWAVLKRSSLFWQISWLVAAAPGPPPSLWSQRMRRTCWIVGFSAHRSTSSCTRIFRSAS